jgi:hypothetical protein
VFFGETFTFIPHNKASHIKRKRTYYEQNTGTLQFASKGIGLVVNSEKPKYVFKSRDQNGGGSHNVKIDNSYFERTERFICLGTILTY